MKTIKTYEDFVNEEINWRKAAVGTALAGSLLGGMASCKKSDIKPKQPETIQTINQPEATIHDTIVWGSKNYLTSNYAVSNIVPNFVGRINIAWPSEFFKLSMDPYHGLPTTDPSKIASIEAKSGHENDTIIVLQLEVIKESMNSSASDSLYTINDSKLSFGVPTLYSGTSYVDITKLKTTNPVAIGSNDITLEVYDPSGNSVGNQLYMYDFKRGVTYTIKVTYNGKVHKATFKG